jgi:riboflavin transporter FmnP
MKSAIPQWVVTVCIIIAVIFMLIWPSKSGSSNDTHKSAVIGLVVGAIVDGVLLVILDLFGVVHLWH